MLVATALAQNNALGAGLLDRLVEEENYCDTVGL